MKKIKHTPGPWVAGERGISTNTPIYRPYKNPEFTSTDGKGLKFLGAAENHNDAVLMAAAPDLLAALKDFVENADLLCTAENECYMRDGKAAIAKAEGK